LSFGAVNVAIMFVKAAAGRRPGCDKPCAASLRFFGRAATALMFAHTGASGTRGRRVAAAAAAAAAATGASDRAGTSVVSFVAAAGSLSRGSCGFAV